MFRSHRRSPRRSTQRRLVRLLAALTATVTVTATALSAVAAPAVAAPGPQAAPAYSVLVFSKTAGFRHDSIPAGITAIQQLGAANDFTVDATEDATAFTDANLARVRGRRLAVHHRRRARRRRSRRPSSATSAPAAATPASTPRPTPSTTGPGTAISSAPTSPRTRPTRQADRQGRGPGAPVDRGAAVALEPVRRVVQLPDQPARPRRTCWPASTRPATPRVPARWAPTTRSPGARTTTAAGPGTPAAGTPTSRSPTPQFRAHLLGGIRTAAGVLAADCGASLTGSFEKVTLDSNTNNPMELDIAPDGRVFYIERDGRLRIIKPDTQTTVTAGTLQRLHRQRGRAARHHARPGLRHQPVGLPVLLADRRRGAQPAVPVHRQRRHARPGQRADPAPGHHPAQHLLPRRRHDDLRQRRQPLPGDRRQHQPVRVRRLRAASTSGPGGRTSTPSAPSGNTNDLRGKVLRIQPEADGTYTVPAGNLFAPGTAQTRPEIYAMGFRNPFRIGVDPETNVLYVADYGPDAGQANPDRGPGNTVEWNIVGQAGNYGWPYCVGNNAAYRDYTFPSGPSGPAFNCAAPVNNSPEQHRADQPAAGGRGHRRLRLRRQPALPGDRRRWRADGRAGLPVRPAPGLDPQVAGVLRRQGDLRRVEPVEAVHDAGHRRRQVAGGHQPAADRHVDDPADGPGVRPGRRAVPHRVGQRVRRQQRRLRRLPDRLPRRRRPGADRRRDADSRPAARRR